MKCIESKHGFTLIEIIIAVTIIGLLAALSLPSFLNASEEARNQFFIKEIHVAADAYTQFLLENNFYPLDKTPGVIPAGMAPYLSRFNWTEPTSIGGQWDWDFKIFGIKAAVSVSGPDRNQEQMKKIDASIDDGNLGSGKFRAHSHGYMYVIDEG